MTAAVHDLFVKRWKATVRVVNAHYWLNVAFMAFAVAVAIVSIGFCIYKLSPWFGLCAVPILIVIRMTDRKAKMFDQKRRAYLESGNVVQAETLAINGLQADFNRLSGEIVGNEPIGLLVDRGDLKISARVMWNGGAQVVVISAGVASLWLSDKEKAEAILAHELCHVLLNDPSRTFKARAILQNHEVVYAFVIVTMFCGVLAIVMGKSYLGTVLLAVLAPAVFFILNFAKGHQNESEFAADLCAAVYGSPQTVISLLETGELGDMRPLFSRIANFRVTGKHRLKRLQYLLDTYERKAGESSEP